MEIKTFFSLLRIHQWYKNFVIYLGLIFSLRFFDFKLFILITAGFFSLSFISSANYIINDIFDFFHKGDNYFPKNELNLKKK